MAEFVPETSYKKQDLVGGRLSELVGVAVQEKTNFIHFILGEIEDLITKETTRFKKPISPECQLTFTLYRMAHGSSFSTVGDLSGVAAPTACQIFSSVTCAIIARLYDRFVCLPRNEEEWAKELECFLKDWEFPCVAAWDGFHVYISSNLKISSVLGKDIP